jgi:hypothetical protein
MNHRKAIPANGITFKARPAAGALVASHSPCSRGSEGTDARKSQNVAVIRMEKAMPAVAAAFGVFKSAGLSGSPVGIA